ncbi:hypothetical protein L1887_19729 [Cichorium endivia]|nr:hypothetical protein L1887_19729 [Cichorium endivia]
MKIFHGIFLTLLVFFTNVEGRYNFHNNQNKGSSDPNANIPRTLLYPPAVPSDPVSAPTELGDNMNSVTGVFNVKDYGAIGDGSTDDTPAFVSAWKGACAVESATVLVPFGSTFMLTSTVFSGPCKPGLVFQVDGILTPPAGPDCWPKKDSKRQWIVFYELDNMTLTGTGTIEGNGQQWWDLPCKPHRGPGGKTLPGPCDSPTRYIGIGSLGVHNSQACVSNISVRNVVIHDSDNGLRIKTWQGGAGSVTWISFENIQMENVRNCAIIDQYYCAKKNCVNQTSAVFVRDISYRNVKGTYDVRSPPIHFACSDSVGCANITMSDVELLPFEGELVDDPFCWNTYGVQETLTIPPINCLLDGMPPLVSHEDVYGCI